MRKAYALATTEGYVACACSDGIVRIFLEGSLEYSATLPRPAPYGYHGLTDANVGAYLALGHRVTAGMKFPDAIACTYLQQGQKIGKNYTLSQKEPVSIDYLTIFTINEYDVHRMSRVLLDCHHEPNTQTHSSMYMC